MNKTDKLIMTPVSKETNLFEEKTAPSEEKSEMEGGESEVSQLSRDLFQL